MNYQILKERTQYFNGRIYYSICKSVPRWAQTSRAFLTLFSDIKQNELDQKFKIEVLKKKGKIFSLLGSQEFEFKKYGKQYLH